VLCEKPLVHDPALPTATLLAQTDELIDLAAERGLQLALCSQYWHAADRCLHLFRQLRPGEPLHTIEATLASPARGRAPDPLNVWFDLGPHLLAGLQALSERLAACRINLLPELDTCVFAGYHARVSFPLRVLDHIPIHCTLHAHRTEDEPQHIRSFTFNDLHFDLQGADDEQGIYRSRIHYPGGIDYGDDFMHQLIAATLAGKAALRADLIRDNQRLLLHLAGL